MTSRSSTSRSEIADRVPGIPVDHVVVAVDQPLLVEVDEHLLDRLHVALVEREALVLVVARGAQALELLHDRAPVALAPLPHAALELLAAELRAARALRGQQLLDLCLGRDAGVVGAEDPFRAAAVHAVEADQHVLHRGVQRVAHVQRARDVRRRDRDRVVLGRRALRLRVEITRLEPPREHARLDLLRVVAGALLERLESRRAKPPVYSRRLWHASATLMSRTALANLRRCGGNWLLYKPLTRHTGKAVALDEAIARLAARQHGVVAHGQLIAAGASRGRDPAPTRERSGCTGAFGCVLGRAMPRLLPYARYMAAVLACGAGHGAQSPRRCRPPRPAHGRVTPH